MIAINITLLFQVIHFFIAYLIIRGLILKPVLTIIQQEKSVRETLLSSLQQIKERIAINEQERLNIWMRCKNYFAAHNPSREKFTRHKPVPTVSLIPLDSATVQENIAKMTNVLIQGVEK